MGFKERYENARDKLISDKTIHKDNRAWLKEFFEKEEYKLKRQNGLPKIDDRSYKTLYSYTIHLRNVLKWFNNKPLKRMSNEQFRKEFKRIYDGLEDGTIKNKKGEPFKDKHKYYNSIFRSKPFELLGKTHIVKDVMEFHATNNGDGEVRFFEEPIQRQLVSVAIKPEHRLLMWLAWDIGENITSLLELRKKDFVKRINEDTKEPEYIVNLPKEILKRSRKARSEITNYKETVEFLDLILKRGKRVFIEDDNGQQIHKIRKADGKYKKISGVWKYVPFEENDKIFNFEYRQASQILERCVRICKAVVIPKGEPVTWKDFRSSMACHLLKEGWTTDEVNARLGHKPSSREIDKYINFLAIDRQKPKKKVYENQINKLTGKVEEFESREKLYQQRINKTQSELAEMRELLDKVSEYEQTMELMKKIVQDKRFREMVAIKQH